MKEDTKDYITNNIPIYAVFLLVLIISGSFLIGLFPCRIQKIFTESVYLKHLCAFFTLVFFIVITAPVENKKNIYLKCILVYIFFILITKVHQNFFLAILFLLVITYILTLHKVNNEEKENEQNNNKDEDQKNKDEDQKNKEENNNKIINNIIFFIYILVFILTIFGILIYMGEKKIEFKNNFTYYDFFFSSPKCNNEPIKVNMKKAFEHAFK